MTNNNRRRRQQGRQPAIRGQKPSRVATSNYAHTTRTFRGTSQNFMQVTNSLSGGVQTFFSVASSVGAYTGSDFISDNFEQYRVKRCKVFAKPSIAALNNGNQPTTTQESILFQNSIYSMCNQTECQSFIDYDTAVNPTYSEILARPNMRFKALRPNDWTMIADFAPKTLTNPSNSSTAPSNTFNSNMWISTNQMDATQYGLRGVFTNRSPALDLQDNVGCVDLLVQVDVEMRGPKNTSNASVSTPTQIVTNHPRPVAPDAIQHLPGVQIV